MPRRTDIDPTDGAVPPRYRAPALDKGLDILELVSRSPTPLSVSAITKELGRSMSELFRMIQVLERRGYIRQEEGGGYAPTSRLFQLGMGQAPVKTLHEVALPIMRALSTRIGQSCHLAMRVDGDIIIIARMESPGLLGYSVRLGYRRPIPLAASGLVLYAFQPRDVRETWESAFVPRLPDAELARLHRSADRILRQGSVRHVGGIVPGIVDLSAPVMRGDSAAAALTVPFVQKVPSAMAIEACRLALTQAAATISIELAAADLRA